MTVTLELNPELEARLREEAALHNQTMAEYAVGVLTAKLNILPAAQNERPKRSIMELEGLGAELWKDIDVEKYINKMRDEGGQAKQEALLPAEPEELPWRRFLPEFLEVAREMAALKQQSLEEFLVGWWAKNGPAPTGSVTEIEAAAFQQRHSGVIYGNDLHAADNDRIDADLAREYDSRHEDAA